MGFGRFFLRKPLEFDFSPPADFIAAQPANIDSFLFAPVQSRHWRQYELWDGTYTLGDLLDYHEMTVVQAENQQRLEESLKEQRR